MIDCSVIPNPDRADALPGQIAVGVHMSTDLLTSTIILGYVVSSITSAFSFSVDHGKSIKGTIIQRFPEGDFKDYPFPSAVELVCSKFKKISFSNVILSTFIFQREPKIQTEIDRKVFERLICLDK